MAALETDQSVGCLTFASNLSNIVINYIDGEIELQTGQSFSQPNIVVTGRTMEYLAQHFKRRIRQSVQMLQHFLPDHQPNPRIDIWHFIWPHP